MAMENGIKTKTTTTPNTILFAAHEAYLSCGIIVDDTNVTADADGKKIIKAGTPLTGNLQDRVSAFSVAVTTTPTPPAVPTNNAVGVILHDADVTNGDANTSLLYFGAVNLDRLDNGARTLVDDYAVAALKGSVFFLTD